MAGGGRITRREVETPDAAPHGIHVDQVAIAAQGVLDIGSVEGVGRGLGGDGLVYAKGDAGKIALYTALSAQIPGQRG